VWACTLKSRASSVASGCIRRNLNGARPPVAQTADVRSQGSANVEHHRVARSNVAQIRVWAEFTILTAPAGDARIARDMRARELGLAGASAMAATASLAACSDDALSGPTQNTDAGGADRDLLLPGGQVGNADSDHGAVPQAPNSDQVSARAFHEKDCGLPQAEGQTDARSAALV
jgi:hypothetical protein